MGLFGTDVVTDWWNGSNLILEGHDLCGLVMVLLPFLPGAVFVVYFFIWDIFHDKKYGLVFFVLFFPLAVAGGTVWYIWFALLTSWAKLFNPDWPNLDDDEDVLGGCLDGEAVKTFGPIWRMARSVLASCPQAILGKLAVPVISNWFESG